jgi:hypothetical protein
MTFQMNNDSDRGFWWGDTSHTNAQGAMSLTTDGKLCLANSLRLGYGETDTTTPSATYKIDANGAIKGASFVKSGGTSDDVLLGDGSTTSLAAISGGGGTTYNGGVISGKVGRSAHNVGHLEGGYNNVGNSAAYSNPIYTIGSGYNPSTTTLGNMYGIGYTNSSSASFINSTDAGSTGASGWGMYVAADGNARIWLNGTDGSGHFKGNVYSNGQLLATQSWSNGQYVPKTGGTFSGALYATAFYETSLRKYKENIEPFTVEGLELVNGLDIVTYDRKDDGTKDKIGVIADDTAKEFLNPDENAVDLYKTTFVQAKAIQELSKKVDEQQAQIEELKALVNKLVNNG